MSEEIPLEVKRVILNQELAVWKNTAWQFQVRHRVNKKLGATPEQLKAIEDEMVKAEQHVAAYEDELKALEKEQT